MSENASSKPTADSQGHPVPSDHQIEFLDSWLMLVEKFVNPKAVLDSPHALSVKPERNQNPIDFDVNAFLSHVHKV